MRGKLLLCYHFISMKRISFCLSCLLFSAAAFAQIEVAPNLMAKEKNPSKIYPITVEYPHQNTIIPEGSKGIFIFGKVTPNGGLLTINNIKVPLFHTGAYLAYLPVSPGRFDFLLEFNDGKEINKVRRTVIVKGFKYQDYTDKFKFDPNYHFPSSKLDITTNDVMEFMVAGSPGNTVLMSFGKFRNIEMQESKTEPGVYKKMMSFTEEDLIKRSTKIYFTMYDSSGKERARITATGQIRVLAGQDAVSSARVRGGDVRLRPAPSAISGHLFDTRLFGKVNITGRRNNFYRVHLDDNAIAWIETRYLEPLTTIAPPKNIAWEISAASNELKTVIEIKNTEVVPFKVVETPKSFDIYLYYTQALNTIMTDPSSPLIETIDYEIVSDSTKKISAILKEKGQIWGYNYRYENNNLIFEINHKPDLFFTKKQPLRNLKIVLDPGHSPKRTIPYDGAVGPSGVLEYEVNYKIAQTAAKALEERGAIVYFSKTENETMGLRDRTLKVDSENAHLFISLHNNALPDNVNPFAADRGFSMFYYYPHSIAFAQTMQKSFERNIGIPSEGVIQADFSVIRSLPQVPSILIENTYLMIPYQEELVKQDRFINMLGNAIAEGVTDFLNPTSPNRNTKRMDVKLQDLVPIQPIEQQEVEKVSDKQKGESLEEISTVTGQVAVDERGTPQ